MTREDLLKSPEYWATMIQLNLYTQIETYMSKNNMNRTELAKILCVSKGYVTQILNGDYDHRISKLVELSLKVGLVPNIEYKSLEAVIKNDGFYSSMKEIKLSDSIKIKSRKNSTIEIDEAKEFSYSSENSNVSFSNSDKQPLKSA